MAIAAALFLLCGIEYHGGRSVGDIQHCVYLRPDCSVAAGTWALVIVTAGALIAAASAYFLEVEPLMVCRQERAVEPAEARGIVRVYVTKRAHEAFKILVDREPLGFRERRYDVAVCSFSNAGRSPLLGLSVTLAVVRTTTSMEPRSGSESIAEAQHRTRKREEILLDHLTASDNDAQRVVYVVVYRDAEMRFDTTVRWTGAASAAGRKFRFAAPPKLSFDTIERELPELSVPGGGGF